MSRTNGTDKMRQLQLWALAENLYTLANRHRENGNHIVAHALYGRALEVAVGIETPHSANGTALVLRIQRDQQAVFEILPSRDAGARSNPQEKAQKAGR